MNLPSRNPNRRAQRGVAAVELALMMPILMALFMAPLFLAIYFWHYTAAQKAAQDAARYLSTISVQEIRHGTLAKAAEDIAIQIVQAEIAELSQGGEPEVEVYCGRVRCTGLGVRPLPESVFVSVRMNMFDTFFGVIETGRYGFPITAEAELNYVGN